MLKGFLAFLIRGFMYRAMRKVLVAGFALVSLSKLAGLGWQYPFRMVWMMITQGAP